MMDPENWKNEQKNVMWALAKFRHTELNIDDIDFLKQNLDVLNKAITQKTAGQRFKSSDVDWSALDITLMNIAIGAMMLYQSGMLDKLKEFLVYE